MVPMDYSTQDTEMTSTKTTSDQAQPASNNTQTNPAPLAEEHQQAKKEGRLEHFMHKHGLHAVGTEPQDNEQQNDPIAILASGGMIVKGPAEETKHGRPVGEHGSKGRA